jgi:cell division septation protein DedD
MMETSLPYPSDKRHYVRRPIKAYVELGEDNGGIIVDASEAGLRVQAVRELEAGSFVRMRFQPNRSYVWAEAKGRIVWTSQTKKLAGIEFSELPDRGRHVLRGLLGGPSWHLISNRGIDSADPISTDHTRAMARTPGTDSTSTGRLDKGTVFLSKSRVPDATKQTAQPPGIFERISGGIARPSTGTTAVVLVILSCVLVSGLIDLFRPDVASRVVQAIHTFIPKNDAASPPTEGVSVLSSSAPIQGEAESSVSSMDSKPSPFLPLPSTRELPGTVLQIAAMKRVDDADTLVESLQANNFPAFVFRGNSDRFYKVFVGPYDNSRSVDMVKEKLTAQGIKSIEVRWLP